MSVEGATVSYNYSDRTQSISAFEVDADTRFVTWVHGGDTGTLTALDMIFISDTNSALDAVGETVFLKYLIVVRVAENRDVSCFEGSTPSVCIGKCMFDKIVPKCGCTPFTFRKNLKVWRELPYCNETLYANCLFDDEAEDEDCRKKCDNPCECIFYQWHMSKYSATSV